MKLDNRHEMIGRSEDVEKFALDLSNPTQIGHSLHYSSIVVYQKVSIGEMVISRAI